MCRECVKIVLRKSNSGGVKMTNSESTVISFGTQSGSEIGASHFGSNLVFGFERFGSRPWEKFDEIHAATGVKVIRFPGGAEAERYFSYSNPNATEVVTSDGSTRQLISPDQFLQYCASTGTKATIVLPVKQLLTESRYGTRDFDLNKSAEVRAYIGDLLEKAGPNAIGTFELGNEYCSFMTAVEYGKVASALALIVSEEVGKYISSHPDSVGDEPLVAVQGWGQSTGGSLSLTDLMSRAEVVMAQFNYTELNAITAVTDHFYFREGANLGEPNYHSYSNISTSISYSVDMMNAWSTITGRDLSTIISEWNVNFRDATNFGLKQVPVLLEMFSTFVASGVDELDFWSTMYNATSLGNYAGELQAAGILFQLMSDTLIGTKVMDVPVASPNYDVYAFSGKGNVVVFVSSLVDESLSLDLDLSAFSDRYDLVSAQLIQVNLSTSDGIYNDTSGLPPWQEPDVSFMLAPQDLTLFLTSGHLVQFLQAHETVMLEFSQEGTNWGTMSGDRIRGQQVADRIMSLASDDRILGLDGNDSLFGDSGDDSIRGGVGADRIWGGVGSDVIYGGLGDDIIEGKANSDSIHGGRGDDFIAGGDRTDTLWGDHGADGFVFREGDQGWDHRLPLA